MASFEKVKMVCKCSTLSDDEININLKFCEKFNDYKKEIDNQQCKVRTKLCTKTLILKNDIMSVEYYHRQALDKLKKLFTE
jgi:hypothetical protein